MVDGRWLQRMNKKEVVVDFYFVHSIEVEVEEHENLHYYLDRKATVMIVYLSLLVL